jgi:hypothetical protein
MKPFCFFPNFKHCVISLFPPRVTNPPPPSFLAPRDARRRRSGWHRRRPQQPFATSDFQILDPPTPRVSHCFLISSTFPTFFSKPDRPALRWWRCRCPTRSPKRHRCSSSRVRSPFSSPLLRQLLCILQPLCFFSKSTVSSPNSMKNPRASCARINSSNSRQRCSCRAPTYSTKTASLSGLRATPPAPLAERQWPTLTPLPLPSPAPPRPLPDTSDQSTSRDCPSLVNSLSCTARSGVMFRLPTPTSNFFSRPAAAPSTSSACGNGRRCRAAAKCADAPAAAQSSHAPSNSTCTHPLISASFSFLVLFIFLFLGSVFFLFLVQGPLVQMDGFSPRLPTGTKAIPRRHPRDQTSLHSPSAAQSTSF